MQCVFKTYLWSITGPEGLCSVTECTFLLSVTWETKMYVVMCDEWAEALGRAFL